MRFLSLLLLALIGTSFRAYSVPLRNLSPGECLVEFFPAAGRKEVKYMSVKDLAAIQTNVPKNKRDQMVCDDRMRDFLKAYTSTCEVFCNPEDK